MRGSKIWAIIVSIIIVSVSIFIVLNLLLFENTSEDENCVDVNRIAGFVYDVCYDSYTKNILMLVKRSSSDYMLDSFDVSFSDIQEKNYNLEIISSLKYSKNSFRFSCFISLIECFDIQIIFIPSF